MRSDILVDEPAPVTQPGVKKPAFTVAATHLAPNRAPKARDAGVKALRSTPATFKGGDLNLHERDAARAVGRPVVGSGVVWLAVPREGWRVVRHTSHDVNSDHPAEFVSMQHVDSLRMVKFLVINCMGVSTGPIRSADILRRGLALNPDVVLASECRDIWAADVERKDRFAFHQPGIKGSSASGVLLGANLDSVRLDRTSEKVASEQTKEGGGPGIDRRLIVRGRYTLL